MEDLSNYEELQDFFDNLTDEERMELASKDCYCGGYGLQKVENGRVAYCECLVEGLIKKGKL